MKLQPYASKQIAVPVSYTHLDVYKRQRVYSALSSVCDYISQSSIESETNLHNQGCDTVSFETARLCGRQPKRLLSVMFTHTVYLNFLTLNKSPHHVKCTTVIPVATKDIRFSSHAAPLIQLISNLSAAVYRLESANLVLTP